MLIIFHLHIHDVYHPSVAHVVNIPPAISIQTYSFKKFKIHFWHIVPKGSTLANKTPATDWPMGIFIISAHYNLFTYLYCHLQIRGLRKITMECVADSIPVGEEIFSKSMGSVIT